MLVAVWVNISSSPGIMYGMTSLTELMNKELEGKGQLWQKCKSPPHDCEDRDNLYANIFGIAVGVCSVGTAAYGLLMDNFGPKLPCFIGIILFGVGNYFLGRADSGSEHVEFAVYEFTIGYCCMALGGFGPYISSFNIANITKHQNGFTSLLAAEFNLTGMMYWALIAVLDYMNVPVDDQRSMIGSIFMWISVANGVLVYLVWPVESYVPNSNVKKLISFRLWSSRAMLVTDNDIRRSFIPDDTVINHRKRNLSWNSYISLRDETAKNQIFSKEFLLLKTWYCVYMLIMSFYLGTVYDQIDPHNESHWVKTVVLFLGNVAPIVLAWPCAILLDKFGYAFGVGTVSLCSVGMFSCLSSKLMFLKVMSSCFFAIYRTFLFATFYSSIGSLFGFVNYGAVLGVATILAAAVSQFAILLNTTGYAIGFSYINIPLAILSAFLFPLSLTLGVWEWDTRDSELEQEGNVKKEATLGLRLTKKWSRFANVMPRRRIPLKEEV